MLLLYWSVALAAVMNVLAHESAHGLVARQLGGRWLGVRFRGGRISTVVDLTGLNIKARRRIAAAGILVDLIMALLSCLFWLHFGALWAEGGFLWTAASVLVNGCPLIPHSDGWQVVVGARRVVQSKAQCLLPAAADEGALHD